MSKSGSSGLNYFPFTGYEVTAGVVTKYIRAGTEIIASKKGSSDKRFYHNDHLGSVNVITDGNGLQIQVNEYDPWGKISRSEGAADSTHAFTSQELDSEGNIHYYGGRYYNQDVGRFVSPDPFVQQSDDPQNLNRYSYVINNPQNYIDPSGYDFDPFEIALILFSDSFSGGHSGGSNSSDATAASFEGLGDPVANAFFAGTLNFFLGNISGSSSAEASETGGAHGSSGSRSQNTNSIGAPGFLESMIPIWGSGREAINDFQEGRYGWGIFNTGIAVSDAFLVSTVVETAAKVGLKGLAKFTGSHTWDATRKWYGTYYNSSLPKDTNLHHWLFEQGRGLGKYVPDWLKNQPWNLMPVTPRIHREIHYEMNALGVWLHGTPTWTKAAQFSIGGRVSDAFSD